MRLPAKWIFVATGVLTGLILLVCILSPSLRFSLITGWEVRALIHFRDRFKPENYDSTCPNYRLYQAGACVRDMITEEERLRYASMTARIYYLATMVSVTEMARENVRTPQDEVEATLNLLEYLNEEMKIVLLRTGGEVDLSPLDSRPTGIGLVEDPEVPLRRRYYANLVDLWIKNWRRDEKLFTLHRKNVDHRTGGRIDILRADRDELFSRFSLDLSRYEKRRLPANQGQMANSTPSASANISATQNKQGTGKESTQANTRESFTAEAQNSTASSSPLTESLISTSSRSPTSETSAMSTAGTASIAPTEDVDPEAEPPTDGPPSSELDPMPGASTEPGAVPNTEPSVAPVPEPSADLTQ